MPTFDVYEVQRETRYRKFVHRVVAESEEDALLRLMMRDEVYREAFDERGVPEEVQYVTLPEPIECGDMGDPDYGPSGYAARPAGQPEDDKAWDEAYGTIQVGDLAGLVVRIKEQINETI